MVVNRRRMDVSSCRCSSGLWIGRCKTITYRIGCGTDWQSVLRGFGNSILDRSLVNSRGSGSVSRGRAQSRPRQDGIHRIPGTQVARVRGADMFRKTCPGLETSIQNANPAVFRWRDLATASVATAVDTDGFSGRVFRHTAASSRELGWDMSRRRCQRTSGRPPGGEHRFHQHRLE